MLIDELRQRAREVLRQREGTEKELKATFEIALHRTILNKKLMCVDLNPAAKLFSSRRSIEEDRQNPFNEEFFCLLPPAPILWLEYSPSVLKYNMEENENTTAAKFKMGTIITLASVTEDDIGALYFAKDTKDAHLARYALQLIHYYNFGTTDIYVSSLETTCFLTEEGKNLVWQTPSKKPQSFGYRQIYGPKLNSQEDFYERAKKEHLGYYGMLSLHALNMMNVKNIILCDAQNNDNQKLNKKRQKQGKLPLVKMYTLGIEVPGKRKASLNKTEQDIPTTTPKPLHFVRGHLADYREGPGLFGKHNGVFYIPQHTRGSIDNGVIKKRYNLQSSK